MGCEYFIQVKRNIDKGVDDYLCQIIERLSIYGEDTRQTGFDMVSEDIVSVMCIDKASENNMDDLGHI